MVFKTVQGFECWSSKPCQAFGASVSKPRKALHSRICGAPIGNPRAKAGRGRRTGHKLGLCPPKRIQLVKSWPKARFVSAKAGQRHPAGLVKGLPRGQAAHCSLSLLSLSRARVCVTRARARECVRVRACATRRRRGAAQSWPCMHVQHVILHATRTKMMRSLSQVRQEAEGAEEAVAGRLGDLIYNINI